MTLSEELQWRGFVNQTTIKDLSLLDTPGITFYFGVDPSSDSMQVGNLATLLMTRKFKAHGHIPILLVGGATGMIGDPAGKDEERQLLSLEQIAQNKTKIADQFKHVMNDPSVEIVDNYDWFKSVNYLDFLRDVGKHFSMTPLLQRDFVARRIGAEGNGMSYAEFSYTIIQGYDYWHLFKEKGVTLQVCGSDQWGNSISGVELIRRVEGKEVHIWSAPLIINTATGKKFGKSEDGAVWLDSEKTSVYQFYQFWLNVDDLGVEDYLKIFTELDQAAVENTMSQFQQDRASRLAQKTLAFEVTKLVHGEERAQSVKKLTEVLFNTQDYAQLSESDFAVLSKELKTVGSVPGADLVALLVQADLAGTNSEARRLLSAGGIYLNGQQVVSETQKIDVANVLHGYIVVRRGKNALALIKVQLS